MNKRSNLKTAILYAHALYDGAEQSGELDKTYLNAKSVVAEKIDSKSLKALDNPLWDTDVKFQIMQDGFKPFQPCDSFINLLKLLIENRRFADISSILRHFILLYREKHNIAGVEVTTAVPLSQEQEKKLKQKLAAIFQKDIELEYILSPEIIGGLVIKYESQLIDVSVKHKLDALEQLMKGTK